MVSSFCFSVATILRSNFIMKKVSQPAVFLEYLFTRPKMFSVMQPQG